MFVFFARNLVHCPRVVFASRARPAESVEHAHGFGVLCLWCIYVAVQVIQTAVARSALAPDATLNTTVQSYRSELEKRRNSGRNSKGSRALLFLGMAMVVVPTLMVRVPVRLKATP